MAQKARKDRAKMNAAALNNLHIGSAIVNGLFLVVYYFFKNRSAFWWFLLSLPSWICQFTLERTGRPTYDPASGALKTSGEDLAAPGLTEYMFDVIWFTWGTTVLVTFLGNRFWFLLAVVPAFGALKGYSLWGAARQLGQLNGIENASGQPAMNRKQRRAA
ncbi:hypothetical protein DL546_004635 [Coniochaeta pulveracea]|uniref:DUF788 domain protein n=1 Tax=Coniochaeta pulveracea TaxID=177199 RepID=A0A420Y013_9PEZI|nr:hypothetical protein DL546_004635 [Coniochaeta pulveracea]